jgi:16S rRNA (guanine527-N7)-methyltransferase
LFHVEHPSAPRSDDPAALFLDGSLQLGVPCSPHTVSRLVLYLKELVRWNEKMNLTAVEAETAIISKHFLDSLAAFKLFEPRPGLRLLDVGSGAGFPGMVLKLQAPDLAVTLLEPSGKKAAFLHHLAGILGVTGLKIEMGRIENVQDGSFDLIMSRALKPELILNSAPRLLAPGGRLMLYRVTPLESAPPRFDICREVSFGLPFVDAPRTLTLLKQTGDMAVSAISTLLMPTVPRGTKH